MAGAKKRDVSAFILGDVFKSVTDDILPKSQDPFDNLYASENSDGIIQPLYNPLSLCQMTEINDTLKQCITAMATNVDGFGWELIERTDEETKGKTNAAAEQEKHQLQSFFDFINPDEDITMLRKRCREDIESCGYGFLEVVNDQTGVPAELYRLPAHSMRITKPDKEWTEFEQPIRNDQGKFEKRKRKKRFRRYVQIIDGNTKIFFKEFWDPRNIDAKTGSVIAEQQGDQKSESKPDLANRALFISLSCSYSIYGLPRWIGNTFAISGSRKAEEINFLYFDNKTIPPLVVTVSGGSLTDDSITRLKELFEHQIKGIKNFHKALILEATPESSSEIEGEKLTPVKIEVKPLTQFMQKDALFNQYMKDNQTSIRSSFRLPPIYIGRSEEYTLATAKESARVAEEQVFEPERRAFDYIFNRTIMASLQANYWTFRTVGAKTSGDADIIKALATIKEAIPIGYLQEAALEAMNLPKGEIPEDLYLIPLGMLNSLTSKLSSSSDVPVDGNAGKQPPAVPVDPEATKQVIKFLVSIRKQLADEISKQAA